MELVILHPYARGLETADTPGTSTNREGPRREDPIATGAAVSHAIKAILTPTTSKGIGEALHHIDMRLATFLYHHHTLMRQKADLLTDTASDGHTSFCTTLQIITKTRH